MRFIPIFVTCFLAGFASASQASRPVPQAVPTFECIGLRWAPEAGAADVTCEVRFRLVGDGEWRQALPLWFDDDEHEDDTFSHEYRGSIVHLQEGTRYEVELRLADGSAEERIEVETWDADFKIARVVTLPSRMEETLTISEGGSAKDGYVVYQAGSGGTIIDGRDRDEVNVRVDANYVIVRGLTLIGARKHGIELGKVQNVVIENCDISGWGQDLPDGWGRNLDSAIFHETLDGEDRTLRRVVIQNNDLHHPRSNSNSWMQARESRNGSRHPIGPQAISFIKADGELVIRHNRIYSDFQRMFNDGMGEWHNFSYGGFPARDSDIYGNFVSHCWDDGLELEGANMNVRCWGNVIDQTFGAIATAGTSLGPVYVFRNIYLRSRKGPGEGEESYKGQFFLKLGGDPRNERYAKGRIFVFHNTILQPEPWKDEFAESSGAASGLKLSNAKKLQTNIKSRNNILWIRSSQGSSIYDMQRTEENDFDYDLHNGRVSAHPESERNGLVGIPVFGEPLREGAAWSLPLETGSLGHDQAELLPNFNDAFEGAGPDVGAIEAEKPLPEYFPSE